MSLHIGLGSVLAVLVVYQRPWSEVHAAELLQDVLTGTCERGGSGVSRIGRLLIYDNSPEPVGCPDAILTNVDYVHDASNGGTRAAYLCGLALAKRLGLSWMLLLDHDTTLSPEYFHELDRMLSWQMNPSVGLLFPRVACSDGALSPATLNSWGTIRPVDPDVRLPATTQFTALASGSVIRVEAMSAIGEIPRVFWLDYLDHWLFREVQRRGYRAELLGSMLRHELSIVEAPMPDPVRLRTMLAAEQSFIRGLGWRARLVYPARLLLRAARAFTRDRSAARLIVRRLVGSSRVDG